MAPGTDCNGPRACTAPGNPLSQPQEMTRAGSLSPSVRAKKHRWRDRGLLSIKHSTARKGRGNGKGAEPLCPAQPRLGAQPLLVFPRLGAGGSAVPRCPTGARPQRTHPGLCSRGRPWLCCQPGPLLFPSLGALAAPRAAFPSIAGPGAPQRAHGRAQGPFTPCRHFLLLSVICCGSSASDVSEGFLFSPDG